MLVLKSLLVLALLFLAQQVVRWTVRHFHEQRRGEGIALLLLGLTLATAAATLAMIMFS